MRMTLQPGARFVLRILFTVLAILFTLHGITAIGHLYFGMELGAMTSLVDVDLEANIPALFNVMLFFIGAFLFYLLGRSETGRGRIPWFLMAGIFVFLGFDEGSQIHEKMMLITLRLMGAGDGTDGSLGFLFYAWIIPYGLALIGLGVLLLPWFIKLEPRLRWGFLITGFIYVTGAIFMESVGGSIAEDLLPNAQPDSHYTTLPCFAYIENQCFLYASPAYVLSYTVEEALEMIGLILCIGLLVDALDRRKVRVEVNFGGRSGEARKD